MGNTAQARTPETQLFHDAFNANPIGIAVESLEGQLLFVNPALCSFLGFSDDELRSKHCIDFSPPEDAQRDWELFQQLRAGSIDHYRLEKRYLRRDGSLVWGRLILSLLKTGPSPLVLAMVEDITEKKKAEETLIRHAAVIESSRDAIASGTLDGIIVSWNSGAERLYGYTEAEAIGKSITMLVPPELPDEEKKILELLKAGGQIDHFETARVTKAGKRINVSLTISPIKDASGRTVGISGIARDITEQKRAEEALRTSEERLRLAQWTARIGTFDLNLRTGVDIWTPEMEALYGLPPGGFGGTLPAFENLVHPDDRKRIIALSREMIRTRKPAEAEWRVVWPDGSVHWLAGRGQVLMDESGRPLRIIGVNIDITESKQAEQALHELNRALQEQSALLQSREELLEIFVRNVPAPVAMLDREMRYVQVSERWCTDYLQGRAQIIGRSHYEIFPDMPERWKEVHRRALHGETLRADEDRWDGKDGPHWARWEVRPWTTPEGNVGGILILTEDITRRKQMEQTLSELSRKLIHSQEQERSRIGRELHDDINQQLALLAIDIEQLRQHPPDSEAEISSGLTEIRDRVTAIAADVQSLSHQLHSPQLEILGIAAAMKGFCREFAAHQRVTVDFTHDHIPKGVTHEVSLCLFRVLQEALHNAVKHSNVRHYEVRLACSARQLHLTVSDRGTGFNAETAMSSGGLGLTSMLERVRLVNGTITIDSEQQRGTSIHIRVPLPTEQVAEQAAG